MQVKVYSFAYHTDHELLETQISTAIRDCENRVGGRVVDVQVVPTPARKATDSWEWFIVLNVRPLPETAEVPELLFEPRHRVAVRAGGVC